MTTTILVAASGGSASSGAVELACRLAKRFAARLEGFHVLPDPQMFVMAAGPDVMVAGELLDRLVADGKATAAKSKAQFVALLARHGLPLDSGTHAAPSAAWREETGYAPIAVAARARFFDLVVLGRSDRVIEQPYSDTIEQTLIRAGRPVLLAPTKSPASVGENVVIGWDGSAAAVHAVTATMPLLRAAKSTTVISVVKTNKSETDGAALIEYLGWHGIAAKHETVVAVHGVGAGEQLLAAARDREADLLIMGGYGHAPWREMLFGGATKQLVSTSLLPLLLTH